MSVFQFQGIPEMQAKLNRLARELPTEVRAALRRIAEVEMTESKKRVPVDTGALRSTGTVTLSDKLHNMEVSLTYGGPAAPYALQVHEDLDAFHTNGQAKYLESVLRELAPHLLARVVREIKLKS